MFLIIVAAVSWSTAGLFTRIVGTDIPTTLLWRSFVGGLCVLFIYGAMHKEFSVRKLFRFSLGEFCIATLSTAGMICFISAFFFTSIANVSFVYGLMPLTTYIMSLIFLKEKRSILSILCCIASAIGMLVIGFGNTSFDDFLGIALALGMTFFMAALTVATKFFPKADTVKSTYFSAFLGALVMLPFASYAVLPVSDYVWLSLYGVMNVGLGFGVYLLGVTRVSALLAALVGLIEIPLAPVWAWILFSERVEGLSLLGGGIIIVAAVVYIVGDHKQNKRC